MSNKILVTGGTGYIGSHTAVELINEGFEVVIIDDLSNSSINVLDSIEKITGTRPAFEQFDICDEAKLDLFFKKHTGISSIIHFAAYKAVGESVQEPLKYYKNNIGSLVNLLERMNNNSVNNIVFSSSCTVYGQPEELPVTEDAPILKAESPYGNTKKICEEIIEEYTLSPSASNKIKSIALRYFNPIGAHPSALIGELPNGVPNNLIPFITQTAAGIRKELSIFGDDYNTPDGTCIRDFINVVDLAKAHVIAIKRLINSNNKKPYEFFNIGTGNGFSVMELVKTFEKVNNLQLNYKIVDRREGDIVQIWADTKIANEELGWKAEKTLEETLESAWKWELNLKERN